MTPADDPTDEAVVQAAADAARDVIFARYDRSEVDDLDVTITFESDVLEVDVYLDPSVDRPDPDRVVEDAVLAAQNAVDDLLA